ncbi:MAG: CDGSH iron-sulfur domain-containing protein [Vampirovibrio sp.]
MTEDTNTPHIAATSPNCLTLEPKKYAYCACGLSADGTFCDGSHRGTTIRPILFEVTEQPESVAICRCKQSKAAPFCDGSHCDCTVEPSI